MELLTKVVLGGALIMLRIDECTCLRKIKKKSKNFVFPTRGRKKEANRRADAATYIWHHMIRKHETFLEINTSEKTRKMPACVVPYTDSSGNPTVCLRFSPAHKVKTDFSFQELFPNKQHSRNFWYNKGTP